MGFGRFLKTRRLGSRLSLSPEVLRRLSSDPRWPERALSGEMTHVCALSVWLENFNTWVSESLPPREIVSLIGQSKKRVLDILEQFHAIVTVPFGAWIQAVFFEGASGEQFMKRAANAAKELAAVAASLDVKGHDFPLKGLPVGMACGTAVVGIVTGSGGPFEYAVVGDIVVLSRLLASDRMRFGEPVLIDESAGHELGEARPLDLYRKPGTDRIFTIYSLPLSDSRFMDDDFSSSYRHGLELLYVRELPEKAAKAFERCLAIETQDEPSRVMLQRCNSQDKPVIRGYRLV